MIGTMNNTLNKLLANSDRQSLLGKFKLYKRHIFLLDCIYRISCCTKKNYSELRKRFVFVAKPSDVKSSKLLSSELTVLKDD